MQKVLKYRNIFLFCISALLLNGVLATSYAQARIAQTPMEVFNLLPNRTDLSLFEGLNSFTVSGNAWFDFYQKQHPSGVGNHLTVRHFIRTSTKANDKSIVTTQPLATQVNPMALSIAILIRIDDIKALTDITMYAGENGFKRYYKYFGLNGYQTTSWFIDNRWALLTFPLSAFQQTGGRGAPKTVDAVQLIVTGKKKAGLRYHISAISLYQPRPSLGYSIMFDDGHRSVVEMALPILSQMGMPATMAMSHTEIGRKNYLSLGQLFLLQNHFGWEIAAHAPGNNMPARSLAANNAFLRSAAAYWQQKGLEVSGFVFAGGKFQSISDAPEVKLVDLIKDAGYLWARSINETFAETLPVSDPMILRAIYVTNDEKPGDVIKETLRVLKSGGWPILVFHRFVTNKAERSTEYNIKDFEKIIRALDRSRFVPVLPTETVLKANSISDTDFATSSIRKAN